MRAGVVNRKKPVAEVEQRDFAIAYEDRATFPHRNTLAANGDPTAGKPGGVVERA
jgi:hypothetical protein